MCKLFLVRFLGTLKRIIPTIHPRITDTLHRYFTHENCPRLSIRAPNEQAYSPPMTPNEDDDRTSSNPPFQINLLLISAEDGRSTMVDLTKVLAGMAQKGKIAPAEINADVVDAELSELVMGEPDLLVLFGPSVVLDGYPPWQVRLTEIL
jgi:dehydrodolichyl diphosphate syntase complex subunit NUS1